MQSTFLLQPFYLKRRKRPVGKPRCRWTGNVSSNLCGLGDGRGIHRGGGGQGKEARFGFCGHGLIGLIAWRLH